MNTLQLAWKNIHQQLGSTLLSILLTAFGVAILCVIYITGDTFEKQLTSNTKGIDLVVGAKGSPLQLILSSLYHVDNPTGNIALGPARQLGDNPFIDMAVPISLGDNFKGHRVIGTEPSYLDLYDLKVAKGGKLWGHAFEAVIGSETARKTGLTIGAEFFTAHGLSEEGHVHDDQAFKVVGILEKSGSVVDNLILCNLESVWDVHGLAHDHAHDDEHEHHAGHEHHAEEHEHAGAADHEHSDDHQHDTAAEQLEATAQQEQHASPDALVSEEEFVSENPNNMLVKGIGSDMLADRGAEVTALLIKYSSPAAIGVIPRLINESTDMQAASPAIESSRLFSLLGVGLDSLTILAYIIMLMAALSVFISLYNALKERKYDLAVMRSMGASQTKLFGLVLVEGLVITLIGGIVGLLLGHTALFIIGQQTSESADFITAFSLYKQELLFVLAACLLGVIAAIIPGMKAYKTSISTILANK